MKLHFITFAEGSQIYKNAGQRLLNQAIETNWFSSSTLWDFNKIEYHDSSWFLKHQKFLVNSPRGSGYWLWKSKIIDLTLSLINENDIILYLDAGCELNLLAGNRFNNYINITEKNNFLAFYLNGPNYDIKRWTKNILLNRFNISSRSPILNEPQIEAGCLFIKSNNLTKEFISNWQAVSSEQSYIYSNDIITENEDKDFIDHRHDQSILTLLLYKSLNFGTTIRNENYFPMLWGNNFHPINMPIAAMRNLTSYAKISLFLKNI